MLHEQTLVVREVTESSTTGKVVVKLRDQNQQPGTPAGMGSVYQFEGELSDAYEIGQEITITAARP